MDAHVITISTGSATKSYDRLPLTSSTISINGLPDGSTITVQATGTITEPGTAENTYSINWGTDNPNDYVIVENLGTLIVTPAVMTVTAGNATKVYGEADPEFTYTVSGLLSGDTAEAFLITLSRETGEDVGSYAIVPAVRIPSDFYEPVYVTGTLEITRLPVTVTVDGAAKIEGEEDPDFTVTIVPASIPLSSIEFEITREPGETQGEYIVTPTGEAEQGNYLVTFVPGTLIIAYDRKPEELPYVSVKIPDELLRDAGTLTAYLTYSDAEAGEYRTIKIVNLEIMPRMKRPEEEDDPSPSTDIYTQLRTIEEKIAGLYDQLAKIRMRL